MNPGQIDELDLSVLPGAPDPLPEKQERLFTEILDTQTTLQVAFPDRFGKGDAGLIPPYSGYFRELLEVARIGLTGGEAHPELAAKVLDRLRYNIVKREAGILKNRYMLQLGLASLASALAFLLLGVLVHYVWAHSMENLFWMLAASSAGVWISFAARKSSYTFEDLGVPEADRLSPAKRLAMVSILTVAFALLMISRAIDVSVGEFSPAAWRSDYITAVLFGFICGFSEQILATRFGSQAARVFDFGK